MAAAEWAARHSEQHTALPYSESSPTDLQGSRLVLSAAFTKTGHPDPRGASSHANSAECHAKKRVDGFD